MLIPPNEATTVVNPVFTEISNRDSGFFGPVVSGVNTLLIDHIPTLLVNRLTVVIDTDQPGNLTIRKWFCGGTLFFDEVLPPIAAGNTVVFSENMLETCQILFRNTSLFLATVAIEEIGRW